MHHFQKDFDQLITDLQESVSGWASPVRLVKKGDGLRFERNTNVDYIKLNNVTEKIEYLLPFIDEIFRILSSAKYFTVLDLTSAYNQVNLNPNSRQFTAFICSRGLFEYTVLPMGVTNATDTFQRLMNTILKVYFTR